MWVVIIIVVAVVLLGILRARDAQTPEVSIETGGSLSMITAMEKGQRFLELT